jgi:hypothetical protein
MRWVVIARGLKGRALAWRCPHDRQLVVRHCGHPTALRPYWVERAGESLLAELGTFRLLQAAQLAALRAAEAGPGPAGPSGLPAGALAGLPGTGGGPAASQAPK